eukprot:11180617-Lingulodinium_polyedra.AAC.1
MPLRLAAAEDVARKVAAGRDAIPEKDILDFNGAVGVANDPFQVWFPCARCNRRCPCESHFCTLRCSDDQFLAPPCAE